MNGGGTEMPDQEHAVVSTRDTDTEYGDSAKATAALEALHRDLGFANTFRIEGIKSALLISTALLAFTVSFRPTLAHVRCEPLMLLAWLSLGASSLGGLLNMSGWEQFYASYHKDYHGKLDDGFLARLRIKQRRQGAELAQWLGLIIGVVALALFSWLNMENVVPRTSQ